MSPPATAARPARSSTPTPSSGRRPATSAKCGQPGRRSGACGAEQDQWRFSPGQLVIVDEASLAHTRTLAAIVEQARAATAKVLLVGDHLQRGSVDARGAFGMLARRGPTAELTSLWRFANPWEARASLELRRAHPAALDTYESHGAISSGGYDAMLNDAIGAVTTASEHGRVAVLQAVDNRAVRELNARISADRITVGDVAPAESRCTTG